MTTEQDQVILTKSVIRAADLMGLHTSILARIIGITDDEADKLRKGEYFIVLETETSRLAILLVRIFYDVDVLVGGNKQAIKLWVHSDNDGLGNFPSEIMLEPRGLEKVLGYLEFRWLEFY